MTYARQRQDLEDLYIPADDGEYYFLGDRWYPAEQPDELDNDEFNVLLDFGCYKLRFASIDLEFKEVM